MTTIQQGGGITAIPTLSCGSTRKRDGAPTGEDVAPAAWAADQSDKDTNVCEKGWPSQSRSIRYVPACSDAGEKLNDDRDGMSPSETFFGSTVTRTRFVIVTSVY
jgi:hypothetical protein